MITVELAEALQRAGLPWSPRSGDRFVIPHRSIDDTVFHVAEMTIEVHDHFGQGVVKFNGTTEWALDSVQIDQALWLPSEEQLRELLGASFRSLRRIGTGQFAVEASRPNGEPRVFAATSAPDAYAEALLDLVEWVRQSN